MNFVKQIFLMDSWPIWVFIYKTFKENWQHFVYLLVICQCKEAISLYLERNIYIYVPIDKSPYRYKENA